MGDVKFPIIGDPPRKALEQKEGHAKGKTLNDTSRKI